jgi:hypothetical protein
MPKATKSPPIASPPEKKVKDSGKSRLRLTGQAERVLQSAIDRRGLDKNSAGVVASAIIVGYGDPWCLDKVCIDPAAFSFFGRKYPVLAASLLRGDIDSISAELLKRE